MDGPASSALGEPRTDGVNLVQIGIGHLDIVESDVGDLLHRSAVPAEQAQKWPRTWPWLTRWSRSSSRSSAHTRSTAIGLLITDSSAGLALETQTLPIFSSEDLPPLGNGGTPGLFAQAPHLPTRIAHMVRRSGLAGTVGGPLAEIRHLRAVALARRRRPDVRGKEASLQRPDALAGDTFSGPTSRLPRPCSAPRCTRWSGGAPRGAGCDEVFFQLLRTGWWTTPAGPSRPRTSSPPRPARGP